MTVSVDAVVYYRICNATVSVANVENAHHSTRLLAQTALRNMLGTRNLAEILSDRDAIAEAMQASAGTPGEASFVNHWDDDTLCIFTSAEHQLGTCFIIFGRQLLLFILF